ncbi:MAG TPA: hypothetical protein VIK91_24440 [Nannocystis sp.]
MVLFGEAGQFVPGPLLSASAAPRTVFAVDVDADGDRDLVTLGDAADVVSVWVADGIGGFAGEKVTNMFAELMASGLHHADLDDKIDLLALPQPDTTGGLRIFRGSADPGWAYLTHLSLEPFGWTAAVARRIRRGRARRRRARRRR